MANQVDFKILPSDQFNVYSPQTRSEKIITYFTLLSKLRGDILSVSSQDDPNDIVSAYYSNVGGTQTLHLVKADGSEVTASNSYAGTVTSVDMSVPTGFAISGNPITSAGTLAVSFASGYSLPTNAIQATWTTAYNRSITSAAVTGTSTKTLTLNQQDGGTITASWTDIDTGLTSVGLTMPSAFSVANSPLTANGTIAVTGAGTAAQYVRGDGQLANFPASGGGGSTINYYLNGSVNQGTFGGTTYYELSKDPIAGAGTNFTRTGAEGPGYIASFITDAGDPALLNIPGGNWNLEIYFNSSSNGRNPSFYGEVYKVDSSNVFTLIASNSASPEGITNGTTLDQYFTSIAVPQTTLLVTDRLAVRIYVNPDTRNITMHTEDNNFCEVITTFSTGLNALNGLTAQVQYFATGTSGTDFSIDSVTNTHTFNLPTASSTNRGALSSTDWTTFNSKASDAFKTIAVSGQSNVVADSAADTLTFEAGSNIVITTDAATDKITISAVGGGTGSVTSVDMSVPTGFAISGNPITSSGTLALAFASGYSLPTDASQSNWNTAYDNSITAFSYNTSTGVLTLTQQDAGTLTATVTLAPFTTTNLAEGTNLYFTTSRARQSLSAGTGISYDNSTGVITNSAPDQTVVLTAGTGITTSGTYPNFTITNSDRGSSQNIFKNIAVSGQSTIVADGNNDTLTVASGTGISLATNATSDTLTITNTAPDQTVVLTGAGTTVVTGTYPSFTITSNDQYVGTVTSVATSAPITGGTITSTGTIGITQSGTSSDGYLSSTDWNTFNSKIGGSGTTNYVAKFTGSGTVGNSQIFDNGTNVGIGTTNPIGKLTVREANTSWELNTDADAVYQLAYNRTTSAYKIMWMRGSSFVFAPNDVEKVRIATDGNVGIGTTSPARALNVSSNGTAGTQIQINGTQDSAGIKFVPATGDNWEVQANTNNQWFVYNRTDESYRLLIDGSGNVGIGTTAPITNLHVQGTNTEQVLISYDSTKRMLLGRTAGYGWIAPYTDGVSYDNLVLARDGGNVGIGTTNPATKLQVSGTFASNSLWTDSGAVSYWGSYSTAYGGLTWDTGYATVFATAGNSLRFGSNGSSPDMVIDTSGNVGIGTTDPQSKVDIVGVLRYGNNAASIGALSYGSVGAVTLEGVSANTSIGILPSGTGKVGINTIAPDTMLHVVGDIKVTGGYYDSSADIGSAGQFLKSTGTGTNWTTVNVIDGSGTANYVAKWSDSDTITDSIIFDNGTNVGIGTSNPGSKLDILSSANPFITVRTASYAAVLGADTTNNYIRIGAATNHAVGTVVNGTIRTWIGTNGNFGIGNTVPASILHVTSSGTNAYSATITKGSNMKGIINTITNNADDMVGIYFATGTVAEGTHWSGITGSRSDSAIDWSTQLNFYTHDDNTSNIDIATQKMVIKGNGNVGIGTTSPTCKLTVDSSAGFSWGFPSTASVKIGTPGTGGSFLVMTPSLNASYESGLSIDGTYNSGKTVVNINAFGVYSGGPYSADMVFKTSTTTTLSEKMRITSAGNVGIGTTAPEQKLHVEGTIQLGNQENLAWAYDNGSYYNYITNFYDTSTGMTFRSGSWTGGNNVDFSFQTHYGGSFSTKLAIKGDGYVGIGTTAPQKLLHISGGSGNVDNLILESGYVSSGVGVAMQFNRGSGVLARIRGIEEGGWNGGLLFEVRNGASSNPGYNGATNIAMKIATNGNVGIGTTSPYSPLQVGSYTGTGGYAYGSVATFAGAWNVNVPTVMLLSTDNSSTINKGAAIGFGVGSEAGSTPYVYAQIKGLKESSGGSYNGYLAFYTTPSGSDANTERMRINGSGNVGIGTTAPDKKLVVTGDGTGTAKIGIAGFIGSNYTGISLNGTLDEGNYNILSSPTDATLYINRPSGVAIQFRQANAAQMIIASGGNVGIGTTNPTAKLYVSGNATDNVGLAYFENTSSGGIYYPAATFINNNGNHSYGIVAGFKTGSVAGSDRPSILFYSDLAAHSWSVGQVTSGWGSNDSFGIGYRASNDPNSFGSWPSNYFTITTGGNVGIGTTSPGAILDVKASASSFNNKIATFQDAYTGSALDIKSQYSGGSFAHMGIQAYLHGSSPVLYNNIVINGLGGYVGIGVLTPDKILHVSGPIRIDDAFGSDPSTTAGNPRLGIGDVEGEIYLADPDVWLSIYLNGIEYVIPAYDPY